MAARRNNPLTTLVRTDFMVVVVATLTTAVAALLIEDLLKWDIAPRTVVELAIVLVQGASLLWLISTRTRLRRTTGTIFHVQALDETMQDLRAVARATADAEHMSTRAIIRWVDLAHRTDPTTGVIDVVDLVDELGSALQNQLNLDTDETGYALAPVLLWPMALALGTQIAPPAELRLLELQGDPSRPTNVVLLDRPARPIIRIPLDIDGAPPAGRLGVHLALTAASRDIPPDQWGRLGVAQGDRLQLTIDPPDVGDTLTDSDIDGLAPALADALIEIRRAEPDRELVVASTVPKTVAFALGWHIAQRQCRFFRNTHLMHWDRDTARFLPMRVRESQPAHFTQTVAA